MQISRECAKTKSFDISKLLPIPRLSHFNVTIKYKRGKNDVSFKQVIEGKL